MFREKDLDVDGMMSYEEFIGHDTKMALAFKAIDKNGDGFLSKTEFRKICPNMTEEQVSISSSCYREWSKKQDRFTNENNLPLNKNGLAFCNCRLKRGSFEYFRLKMPLQNLTMTKLERSTSKNFAACSRRKSELRTFSVLF